MSSIKLKHSNGNSMSIEAPATNPASNLALKLPATIGSANQFLKNSGTAGTLGWSSVIENSDGDVLIGRTSTIDTSEVLGLKGPDGDSCTLGLTSDGTTQAGIISFNDDDANFRGRIQYNHNGDSMVFHTAGSERMRIDSSGNVGIGTNDPTNADSADGGLQIRPNHSQGAPQVAFKRASGGSSSTAVVFVNGNVGKGSITYDASGTAYNTSSDYRLKENVVSISDGITRLKTLKPSRFNFIDDETNTLRDGFLAHEVSSIVPEAISGTKDEVDENKKPIYQGIDQSKIVPLLTAALQEAITKIETLETKVSALEAG